MMPKLHLISHLRSHSFYRGCNLYHDNISPALLIYTSNYLLSQNVSRYILESSPVSSTLFRRVAYGVKTELTLISPSNRRFQLQ